MTNGHGISVPGHVAEAELGERGREVADAARPEDDQGQAAEQGERAEGHDERRQAAARDEQAVEQAAERADDEDERDRDLERDAGRPQEAEERARQAGHRLDRQVDLAGDDDQGHRQGHDRDLHQGGDQVARSCRRVRKNGDRALPSDDQPEQGDEQQRLPAREQARSTRGRPGAGAAAALIGCGPPRRPRWSRRRMSASALTATRITSAVDRLQPELRQADEDQGVGDEAEEERAERGAGERPGAAEDVDPADDDRGDDREHRRRSRTSR